MGIYSAPDYSMGKVDAVPPVTMAERQRAEAELRRMRSALRGWLKYRNLVKGVLAGRVKARVSPAVAATMIDADRDRAVEQRLARQLYVLLSEVFDASMLPSPDVSRDPEAAVKLAEIAIAGRLPMESTAPGPEAQGLIWLWPAVVVVGMVLFTIVFKIRSDADVAKTEKEIECIKMGACTDWGFWLKVGGVTLTAWLLWDKFGLREAAGRARRRVGG